MVIGIDCRFWRQTGVGRYTQNLVANLSKIDKKNDYVLFALGDDINEIKSSIISNKSSIIKADIPWHGVAEQLKYPSLLDKAKLDVMHFPYFSVPIFYRGKFIVTVHDLIINSYKTGRASTLPYPLYLAKRAGYSVVLSNALKNAQKIIVPSNSVKEDVEKHYPNCKKKIEVIYEAGFENPLKKDLPRVIDERYILRVGNFYPHKNVEKLIEAFRDFLFDNYNNHDIKLVLVGKRDYFYGRIKALITDVMLSENVVFIENPDDEKLASLYQNALATVIPSLSEGFSLTGIEALSYDCPVLASDIATHREILEKAAIYCNPYDAHDIKLKLDYIANINESDRSAILSEGKKQIKKYSWEKMARKTLTIYENTNT